VDQARKPRETLLGSCICNGSGRGYIYSESARPVLPRTTFAGPSENVNAERVGDMVTVSWSPVDLTVDKARGYLIEAQVCQDGQYISIAVQTDDTFYEFTDEVNCASSSSGRLYTAEKHGYSDPVAIPWP
jgi:hypothetical protein